MLSSEAQPFARTGGLGDVLGSLPGALRAEGVDATVMLPGFRGALARLDEQPEHTAFVPVSSRTERVDFHRVSRSDVPVVVVRADRYFDRDHLYGPPGGAYDDNAERFVVFCRAALEWLRHQSPPPDVLHAHDWQAALAIAFLRANAAVYPELAAIRTVLTIHNLAYQGRFWAPDWHLLNLDPGYFTPEFLEFYGEINFLKAGMVFADALTTVSPRYAREIQTPAFGEGLDGVVRDRADRLHGIANGIDYAVWNPATDPHIPATFDAANLAGKTRCRAALQRELGLPVDEHVPLLAMITRLATQKGADLALAALPDWLRRRAVQLVVLGNGDPGLEHAMRTLASSHPESVATRIGFDDPLAHRIEAGADLFLMPSRFEPCGLNQLYSLRYGTIPVVHAVGGLDDTVTEFDAAAGTGNGFKFGEFSVGALDHALQRAIAAWSDPAQRARLRHNGMTADHSWADSARRYRALYDDLLRPVRFH